jgi:hypothetical protein
MNLHLVQQTRPDVLLADVRATYDVDDLSPAAAFASRKARSIPPVTKVYTPPSGFLLGLVVRDDEHRQPGLASRVIHSRHATEVS